MLLGSGCRREAPGPGSVTFPFAPALIHTNILEPQRPTVFAIQPLLAVGEAAGDAALTFGVIGAIEEGDVLVAYISEPDFVLLVVGFLQQEDSCTYQWILLLSSKRPSATLCTGASPHRS